jgi:hypothetical protein
MAEENLTELSKKDKKWQSFNLKLKEQMRANDFWGLSATYYEMAAFLDKQGSKFEHLKQIGDEMKREAFKQDVIAEMKGGYLTKIETYANSTACEECKKRSGTLVSVKEAINNMPVPFKECTNKYCSCGFIPTRE